MNLFLISKTHSCPERSASFPPSRPRGMLWDHSRDGWDLPRSCARCFVMHIELLLFPSPFLQQPRVPTPKGNTTRVSTTSGGPQGWHRGFTATTGPGVPVWWSPAPALALPAFGVLALWAPSPSVTSLARGGGSGSCLPALLQPLWILSPGPQGLAGSAAPSPACLRH